MLRICAFCWRSCTKSYKGIFTAPCMVFIKSKLLRNSEEWYIPITKGAGETLFVQSCVRGLLAVMVFTLMAYNSHTDRSFHIQTCLHLIYSQTLQGGLALLDARYRINLSTNNNLHTAKAFSHNKCTKTIVTLLHPEVDNVSFSTSKYEDNMDGCL